MNTATDLKQQVYQVIEQLPPAQLPEVLRFSEGLLQQEHPWLKYAGMFKDDPDWDIFQAAIAEYRKEVDLIHGQAV